MQHRVRQVEKERSIFVLLVGPVTSSVYSRVSSAGSAGRLTTSLFRIRSTAPALQVNDFDQVEVVQQPEVMVEALIVRQKRFVKSQMPLADARRRVTVRLEQFRNRQLVRMDPKPRNPPIRRYGCRLAADSTRSSAPLATDCRSEPPRSYP